MEHSPGASDFVYQVNRPRLEEGNETNRLMKWTVLTLHGKRVTMEFGGGQAKPREVDQGPIHSCRLTLDINSIQQEELILNSEAVQTRFGSFVDQAKEIATRGNVA